MTDLEIAALLDEAISSAATTIQNLKPGDDLTNIGEISEALAKMIRLRRTASPQTAADIADQVVALGIKPTEFLDLLREAWHRAGKDPGL